MKANLLACRRPDDMTQSAGLHVDGIVFSLQRNGGISVVFRELLSRMGGAGIEAVLSLEHPLLQRFAATELKGARRADRGARPWERYRACRRLDGTPAPAVFHSSYYRIPEQAAVATVVTVHDFAYERCVGGLATRVHSWQKRKAIARAQTIVCVSQSTRRDLLELVGIRQDQRVEVVPNGVSDSFLPLQDSAFGTAGPPFALFVGQRGRYKNFGLAVAALRLLPDWELHCVGGPSFGRHELAGCDAQLRSRIRHLGALSTAELNRQYNQAACLLYPSSYEGFGIPVVEAMRAGCPVVSIACDAVVEVGGDALTIAEAEPASVAAAMRSMLEPARRDALRSRGLVLAKRFSWDDSFRAYLRIYRDLGL